MPGAYLPLQILDAGAASEVALARSPDGGHRVVLRTLRNDMRRDGRMAREWLAIGRALKEMDHPALVRVLDTGEEQGEPWIAMELLEGETLRWLQRRAAGKGRPLSAALVVHVARHVTSALTYLHTHGGGHVHRAIVPGKILVREDGSVKLLAPAPTPVVGGNTALVADEAQQERRRYTPPESASGPASTPTADLWQLGVLLHELLTGEPLFAGDTDLAVLRAVISRKVPSVAERRHDLPAGFADVVDRLLRRNPADRFQEAGSVAAALRQLDVSERDGLAAARDSMAAVDELDDAEVLALRDFE